MSFPYNISSPYDQSWLQRLWKTEHVDIRAEVCQDAWKGRRGSCSRQFVHCACAGLGLSGRLISRYSRHCCKGWASRNICASLFWLFAGKYFQSLSNLWQEVGGRHKAMNVLLKRPASQVPVQDCLDGVQAVFISLLQLTCSRGCPTWHVPGLLGT